MKRLLALLFILAFPVLAQSPTSAQFAWTYAFNSAYPVACTASVTTNCVQSFILSQGGTTVATVPATSATSYTYKLTTLPAPGTYTYTLVAVGAFQGGTIQSLPVTVSLQVPGQPVAPSGFTVVLQ